MESGFILLQDTSSGPWCSLFIFLVVSQKPDVIFKEGYVGATEVFFTVMHSDIKYMVLYKCLLILALEAEKNSLCMHPSDLWIGSSMHCSGFGLGHPCILLTFGLGHPWILLACGLGLPCILPACGLGHLCILLARGLGHLCIPLAFESGLGKCTPCPDVLFPLSCWHKYRPVLHYLSQDI